MLPKGEGVWIRLVTARWSPESIVIRFGTRSKFSHVEFVRISPNGSVTTLGSRADGVKFRAYDDYATSESWFTAPQIEMAYCRGTTLIGARYNFLDLLGIAADTDWHTDGRYICSEFVARSFELANAPLLNPHVAVWRVTPRDITLSTQVSLAYVIKP